MILHGNLSAIVRDFSVRVAVLRRHFLPNAHVQCCMLLQGTLGHDFDIFAASSASTAWVLFWKTRSRPIGVRVCPGARPTWDQADLGLRGAKGPAEKEGRSGGGERRGVRRRERVRRKKENSKRFAHPGRSRLNVGEGQRPNRGQIRSGLNRSGPESAWA